MEIVCKNLSVGYNNTVLHKDINFTIPLGSYVCVIGDNGVGKSTLIKTLLGLLSPLAGSICFGENLKARDIGYLPQQSETQKDFPASVFEVVLSGCLNRMGLRPFYTKLEKKRARDMLEKLGISALCKKSFRELSGGQQQRVLLARALCATNKALLLDEPTANLDALATKEFYALLKRLNAEGITIIMITHNFNELISDADYVLCLNKCGVNCMTTAAYTKGADNVSHSL